MPAGTNGGVSLIGTAASLVGGLFIGLSFFLATPLTDANTSLSQGWQWTLILFGGLSGVVGSLIDSFLGATLQYSGFSRQKMCVVEYPGPDVKHIAGRNILDNHQVNFLASLLTSALCASMGFFLF